MALKDENVLLLDAQATGASPAHGHLMELGWAWTSAATETLDVRSEVVELPPGAEISSVITRVTGIDAAALEGASGLHQVWARLGREIEAHSVRPRAVMHCARFECSFLQPLVGDGPLPFISVCTLELARRLFPDLPRRGLRALAGYFGLGVTELRRSADHVEATAFVWRHVVEALAEHGVHDWPGVDALLAEKPPRRGKKKVYPLPKAIRLAVPETPGVYRMLRTNGDVLYVGKATSLRRRVNSYFQKQSGRNERMLELLSQVRDLDVTPTATPLEAALLECDEIKRLRPPYNTALQVDGREPWFVARDLSSRAEQPSEQHPLGPLPSAWQHRRHCGLRALLRGEREPEVLREAFGWLPDELEEDVLQAGLDAFSARNPDASRSRFTLGRAGLRLAKESGDGSADEHEEDEDGEDRWDPPRVVRRLEDGLAAFALELRRAAWLRRLANASVVWSESGSSRVLRVQGGRVAAVEPWSEASWSPPALDDVAPRFDIATYDRLRVLTTELRRVVLDAGDVRVRMGSRPWLRSAALARMLAWV